MTSIVTHRNVRTTFKANPRNGFLGMPSRTFKTEKHDQDIGELFEVIAREMVEDKIVFSYPSTFSLINLTNVVNNRSIGYAIAPPKEILQNATGLVFTFALTSRPYSNKLPTIETLALGSDGAETISYWSSKKTSTEYFSISLTKNGLQKLRLNYNTEQDMLYIYNCVGAVTKSFVLDHSWYRENQNHRDLNGPTVNEYSLYSKYYGSTFKNVMVNSPMNSWIYNREFWMQAQSLLSANFIHLENFGLYFLLYLADQVPQRPTSRILEEVISSVGGITDYLTKGVKDFTQALQNPAADITDNCYALIHLMEACVYDGGLGLAVDKDVARKRVNTFRSTFEINSEIQSDLYSFLSDGKRAYVTLVNKDIRLVRLLEEIL